MNIESTNPGHAWNFYLSQSNPRAINATECKFETMGNVVMSITEWNARRLRVTLTGKATAKAKNIAYAELLKLLIDQGYISQDTLNTTPKTFS